MCVLRESLRKRVSERGRGWGQPNRRLHFSPRISTDEAILLSEKENSFESNQNVDRQWAQVAKGVNLVFLLMGSHPVFFLSKLTMFLVHRNVQKCDAALNLSSFKLHPLKLSFLTTPTHVRLE